MRVKIHPNISSPSLWTVRIGCLCPSSNIRTMLVHSWLNGTVDWQRTQPLLPRRHPNSSKPNRLCPKSRPLEQVLGLTEPYVLGLVKKKNLLLGSVLSRHDSNWLRSKLTIQMILVLRLHGNPCTSLREATGSGGMVSIKTVATTRTGMFSSRSISPIFIARSISISLHTCKICGPIQRFHHRLPLPSLNQWSTVLHYQVSGTVPLDTTHRLKERRSTLRSSMSAMTLPTSLFEWMQPPFLSSKTCRSMENHLI